MKRPVVLIVGAAAVALIAAAVGASAHTGLSLTRLAGVHSAVLTNEEASGARTETPEPSESPEASETPEAPKAEPTEAPEPADTESETGDNDNQGEDQKQPAAHPTGSGEHEGGGGGDHHGGD